MDPARHHRLMEIVVSLIDLEPSARGEQLSRVCADDDELRREVESLLAANDAAGSFLDQPAYAHTGLNVPGGEVTALLGKRLLHYAITEKLGEGGMGVVYKARDTHLDRFVAVKVLPHECVADSSRRARFVLEAKAASALNHPNIVVVHDIASEAGADFIVMEFVAGKTLGQLIPRKGMRFGDAIHVAIQVAGAMARAHEAGIVHRDLKPSNVMVDEHGVAKVVDFGLAKLTEKRETGEDAPTCTLEKTQAGMLVGTAAYMSPEQGQGRTLDQRSDIFSFGAVLYEMITGRRAFRGDTPISTISAVLREEPKRPSQLTAGIPRDLEKIILRCLRKEPDRRFQHMDDLRVALLELKEDSDSGKAAEQAEIVAERRTKSAPVFAVVTSLVAGLAIAAFWPLTIPEPPQPTPFATESELQAMPRWSPTGDRIAYVAAVDGVLQVFTKSLSSPAPTQITHEPESCMLPVWSSDGSRIYYLTRRRPNTGLRSVAVAGGGSEKVLDGVYRADLSPDGKTLAVLAGDSAGSYRLAFSSPPGAAPIPYAQPPLSNFRDTGTLTTLAFDPSGKYVGLYTSVRQSVEFWKIPVNGRSPQELLRGKGKGTGHFAWLNDSSGIVTDALIVGSPRLERIDFSTGVTRLLTADPVRDITPALSPGSGTLAFAAGEAGYDIIDVPLTGAPPRDIIATGQSELAPAWAPDGAHFAYVTHRSGVPEIWLRNRADGSERLIVGSRELPGLSALFDCEISPDGARVAYRAHRGAEVAIWVSPLSGEAPVRLWDDPARSVQRGPSWSPDGNWIAYYGARDGRPAVMKARIGNNQPSELLAYMSRNEPVRWSPRGDWIAFRDGESLRVVSPDGKQNRVISRRTWETYGWAKAGTMLYGIADAASGRLVLASIDLEGEREKQIADLGPPPPAFYLAEDQSQLPYRGFSLHPDGKSFLTSIFRAKTQIYLLKNFDRSVRLIDHWLRR
jgi:serine/threonine protein kinase